MTPGLVGSTHGDKFIKAWNCRPMLRTFDDAFCVLVAVLVPSQKSPHITGKWRFPE